VRTRAALSLTDLHISHRGVRVRGADLAQHRYLDEDSFVDYLDYLQYWREPQYCKYILFPHCLRMLELLQHASFREALKREDFKTMIFNQQNWHWRFRAGVVDTTAGTAAGIAAGTEPAPA